MHILGINQFSHDAAAAVLKNGQVLFAAHEERYSKQKNDWYLGSEIVQEALSYGQPDLIAYYEKPMLKSIRHRLFGGHYSSYQKLDLGIKTKTVKHHKSHAAAGYYTSKFDKALVIVVDSIGEFETATAWVGHGDVLRQIYSMKYPVSFGLFYSAFTESIGFKPNEEEYIMMGLSAYGDKERYLNQIESLFPKWNTQKHNFHYGVNLEEIGIQNPSDKDIAAAVQFVFEKRIFEFISAMQNATNIYDNLVLSGGCALNATANGKIRKMCKKLWVNPNPGDSGSSLGAALAIHKKHVHVESMFLGTDIKRKYEIEKIINSLETKGVAAVASGRAEFGPRALGNRSIFGNASLPDIQDIVNIYKGREAFRPFGCVVLEHLAHEWFDIQYPSPYMKETFTCLRPGLIPGVVHADGTTRVQTVNEKQHKDLFELLQKWNKKTGVPLLLNTSLNIKGQPIINDHIDVGQWNRVNKDLQII